MSKGLIGFGTSVSVATITSAGTNAMVLTKVAGDTGTGTAFTGNLSVPAGSFLQVDVAGNATIAGGNGTAIAVTGNVTTIARASKISEPSNKVAKADVSGFDAQTTPSGKPIADQVAGWVEADEGTMTFFYQKGGSQWATLKQMEGGTYFFLIVLPDGNGSAGQAFISHVGREVSLKDCIAVTINYQPCGGSDFKALTTP